MTPRPIVRLLLLLAIGTGSLSCYPAPHMAYHSVPESVEERNGQQPYDLAYLEFDEQGDPWELPEKTENGQLDRAIEMIDRVNASPGDDRGDPDGAIFVTFVHGWRNDAAPGNGNLANFRESLAKLAAAEEADAARDHRPVRPVAGIYVAWRGDSIRTPKALPWLAGLDFLSYWNRNDTALRIASRPPATQALLILLKEIQGNRFSRSIVIGHSMGALILERAVSQAFVGVINEAKYRPRCADPCPDCAEKPECPRSIERPEELRPGKFKAPADLIVFVNSAAPAIQAKHLIEIFSDPEIASTTDHGQIPFILSVTAENDKATKRVFPIAMRLESQNELFRKEKGLDQRSLILHTGGHTRSLYSHDTIDYRKDVPCEGLADVRSYGVVRCIDEEAGGNKLVFTIHGNENGTAVTRKFMLEQQGTNRTPYWILQAPRSLIDGHSKFFNDGFSDFLRGIITALGANEPGEAKTYSTEMLASAGTSKE